MRRLIPATAGFLAGLAFAGYGLKLNIENGNITRLLIARAERTKARLYEPDEVSSRLAAQAEEDDE